MFDTKACGSRIRELRRRCGITQEALAKAMNITDVHLRRLESGVRGPSIELLIEFAAYFQVSLDYLMIGKESREDEIKDELNEMKNHLEQIIRLL